MVEVIDLVKHQLHYVWHACRFLFSICYMESKLDQTAALLKLHQVLVVHPSIRPSIHPSILTGWIDVQYHKLFR